MNIPNLHLLQVKHVPMTDTTPARVRIRSQRFNQSVIIPYTNEPGSNSAVKDTAIAWLLKEGFTIVGQCELKEDYGFLVDDRTEEGAFKPLK
jgi:hypothetical protein